MSFCDVASPRQNTRHGCLCPWVAAANKTVMETPMSAKTGHDIRPHRRDAPLQGTVQWQRKFLSRGKPTPKAMPSFISEVGPARNCSAHHRDITG